MSPSSIRLLFRTAASFNLGAVLVFLPQLGIARAMGLDPIPTGTMFEYVGIGAVLLFGVGYWMTATSPDQHRGIVQIGLAGKVMVIVIVLALYAAGTANLRLLGVISGDVVYSVLFARYLLSTGIGVRSS